MAVLRPSGELDLATADRFRREVQSVLAEHPDCLVVDMTDVSFLDSSGIAVLASAYKAQRDREAELHVVNPQAIVQRALELVGLAMLIAPGDSTATCAAAATAGGGASTTSVGASSAARAIRMPSGSSRSMSRLGGMPSASRVHDRRGTRGRAVMTRVSTGGRGFHRAKRVNEPHGCHFPGPPTRVAG